MQQADSSERWNDSGRYEKWWGSGSVLSEDSWEDEGVVESSQKISISRNCIENKNQACYSSGTQINSSICNVSIFINSFTSSPDIRALIKNENHRKQINTCLIKKVVHIYWYIYKMYAMIFIKISSFSFKGVISVYERRAVYEQMKIIKRIKLAGQISIR